MPRTYEQTEESFRQQVQEYARLNGWLYYHTHDSRRSPAGFLDLVLVRGPRLVIAELKRQRGVTTKAQNTWIARLTAVVLANEYVEVYVWRPSDWALIEEVLRRR